MRKKPPCIRAAAAWGLEPTANLRIARSQFADEAFDRVIGAGVAVVLDQILVDRDRVAALSGFAFDEAAIRLAAAARSRQVGGHFRRGLVHFGSVATSPGVVHFERSAASRTMRRIAAR
jgi:hypothetical protein